MCYWREVKIGISCNSLPFWRHEMRSVGRDPAGSSFSCSHSPKSHPGSGVLTLLELCSLWGKDLCKIWPFPGHRGPRVPSAPSPSSCPCSGHSQHLLSRSEKISQPTEPNPSPDHRAPLPNFFPAHLQGVKIPAWPLLFEPKFPPQRSSPHSPSIPFPSLASFSSWSCFFPHPARFESPPCSPV